MVRIVISNMLRFNKHVSDKTINAYKILNEILLSNFETSTVTILIQMWQVAI